MNNISFADIAIVSCGTLSLELNYLKKEGFTGYLMKTQELKTGADLSLTRMVLSRASKF